MTEGKITIDGKDVRGLTFESLRNQIGLVQQDVYLFCGTIRDNIAYGKPEASMEEIVDAAKKANIHDFIMSLPDGYDSYVGERGTRLLRRAETENFHRQSFPEKSADPYFR